MKIFIIAVILVAIAIAGIAVKMFFKKGGEFKKSCSNVDPKTGKNYECVCGGSEEDPSKCENYREHHQKEE